MLIEPKRAVSSLDSAALHFPNMKKRGLIILTMLVLAVASLSGCRPDKLSSLSKITIEGVTSYYTYSNMEPGSPKQGLPAIIIMGHPSGGRETLQRFVGQFSEPVLLIWCGLLSDLDEDTLVDDKALWQKKRQDFLASFNGLKERLRFDEKRVYLTGFSFTGAYAWMLAYDRPELYAGVVAMSAVSYPAQLQQNLESAVSVVTVVVRGENDSAFPRRLAQEKETGRVIEAMNPHSRFVLKQGEGHGDVAKYWLEHLKYVLQFSKAAGRREGWGKGNLSQSRRGRKGERE